MTGAESFWSDPGFVDTYRHFTGAQKENSFICARSVSSIFLFVIVLFFP